MTNPFELIESRLNNIESLILDLKDQPKEVEIDKASKESFKKHTVKGAADFLGIAPATIYSKKSRGELTAYKAPGSKRLFFFETDLINYLKSGKQKSNTEIQAEAHEFLTNKRGGAK